MSSGGKFSSVAQLCLTLCDLMDCSTAEFPVHHQIWELAQIHVCWVGDAHLTISSSVIPCSSCLQSFPALGSFPVSWLFTSGGQSIGALASASVLPMNIQDWVPLGLTGCISFQSKGLSRVFVQHHSSKELILWHSAFFKGDGKMYLMWTPTKLEVGF